MYSKTEIIVEIRNKKKHLCSLQVGAELVHEETRVNTRTKLLVMTALRLLAVNTGFNKLGTETENSMTETQKRDTTDALKGKRRAVVRRGTNTVNCL